MTTWPPEPGSSFEAFQGVRCEIGQRGIPVDGHGELALREQTPQDVHDAAGAVGSAAAAFAIAEGAHVIGTASEANHDRLRALGVVPVTCGDGLVERVRAAAPDGVGFGLDAAGSGSLPHLVELVGDVAHVVTVADHQRAGELGVRSINAENDSSLLRRAADHAYTPYVSEVMSFRDASLAHAGPKRAAARSC